MKVSPFLLAGVSTALALQLQLLQQVQRLLVLRLFVYMKVLYRTVIVGYREVQLQQQSGILDVLVLRLHHTWQVLLLLLLQQ